MLHGVRAMAISLDVPLDAALNSPAPPHWDSGELIARRVLPLLLEAPAGAAFNLNVPDRSPSELGELRLARLARVDSAARSSCAISALFVVLRARNPR